MTSRKDPQELHNVIEDPAYSEVLAQLIGRLLTWYLETGDVVPHDLDPIAASGLGEVHGKTKYP